MPPSQDISLKRFSNMGNLFLVGAFLILLASALLQAKSYPCYTDDFFNFRKALIARTHPVEIWKVYDVEPRRAPLAVLFFSWEAFLFGFRAAPYLGTLVVFHFLNAILVGRLCKVLGGTRSDQTLCSLLFLCSSAFYQVMICIIGTARVLSLFFMLLAALSWAQFFCRNSLWSFIKTLAFQGLSMGFNEGPMVFPFLAALVTWQISSTTQKSVAKNVGFSLLAVGLWTGVLLMVNALPGLSSRETLYQLSGSFRPFFKMASLAKSLMIPLFFPPKGFFGVAGLWEKALRVFPYVLMFGTISLIFVQAKPRGKDVHPRPSVILPFLLTGFGWMAITVLSCLLHPLGFEHTSRYLYFPAVGFSLIAGKLAATALRKAERVGPLAEIIVLVGIGYVLTVNLTSTLYHSQRYVVWVTQQRQSYYEDVHNLFGGRLFQSPHGPT